MNTKFSLQKYQVYAIQYIFPDGQGQVRWKGLEGHGQGQYLCMYERNVSHCLDMD